MDYNKLKEQWLLEERAVFQGWDFSHLDGRWHHDELNWDYVQIVRSYLKSEYTLLDMGTGGGEYLLTLNHPHHLTYVTEAYPPNVELCSERLAPLGITVRQIFDDSQIPYSDGIFDVVVNRHESFDMREVDRILKPGGIFITEQVGGENGVNLRSILAPGFINPFADHTLMNNVKIIASQGFEILMQEEAFPVTRFFDVGAVVYFAKAIVWEFPDFSVPSCFPQLCDLQKQLDNKKVIENREHRFIIAAQKPIPAPRHQSSPP